MTSATGISRWLMLMVFSITLAIPAASSAIELQIENELLLELRLDGNQLGLDILGYQRGSDFLLSLEELFDGLEFAISVDGAKGRASGWYISPERKFSLDMTLGEVSSGGKKWPLGGDEVVIFEGGLYAQAKALERWFPLQLTTVVRQLYLDVEATLLLPIQSRLERKNFTRPQSSGYQEPQYPLKQNPYQLFGPHITKLRLGYSTLRQNSGSGARYDSNYALLSRGDLSWMTSTFSLAGTTDDSLTGAFLKLERTAFEGPLSLNHVELGDVSIGGRGFLLRGGGVKKALDGRFADNTVYLEGSQLPDWDVELYQNGQLIANQTTGEDGRYRFDDISLLFGENRFEIKFYGPYGEVESRYETHFLGADMLAPGRISYDLSAVQEGRTVFGVNEAPGAGDRDSGLYTADFNLGLSRNLTIGASIRSRQVDAERVDSGSLRFGLNTSLFSASASYNYQPLEQDSIDTSIRTRLGDSSVNLSYTQFIDELDLVSSTNQWQSNLEITSSLFAVPIRFDAIQQEMQDSTEFDANFGTTIPLPGSGRFSTSLFYDSIEDRTNGSTTKTSRTGGQTNIQSTFRPWTFRLGAIYSLAPKNELLQYSVESSLSMDRDTTLKLDVRQNETNGLTDYRGGLNWRFDAVQISANVNYNSNERWAGLITLSTNLVGKPGKALPMLDSRASEGMASVEVQVLSKPEAEPVEGVMVKAPQVWRSSSTDKTGMAYLSRMMAHRQTDIELDESTITDSELRSTNQGLSVILRPGNYMVVKFPMIRTAELEGYVTIADGKDGLPVSRALVQLKTLDGEIVAQKRSAFDGFFLFDGIEPGVYQITLETKFVNRLLKKPAQVKVSSNSGVIRALNFTLSSEPLRGIMQGISSAKELSLWPDSGSSSAVSSIPFSISPVAVMTVDTVQAKPLQADSAASISPVSVIAAGTSTDLDNQAQGQAAEGSWFVQVVALSSVQKAEVFWRQINQKLPVLSGSFPKYQKTGDVIRLLVGPGLSRQAARELCETLKQGGQDCFIRRVE